MKQRGSDFKSPDSPGSAKKKRRTSTTGPGPPTTPPASQTQPMPEFIPPPISGYGESIVASNPFDDVYSAPPMRPMPQMTNRGGPSPQMNLDMCSPPMMQHHIGSPAPDYPFPPRQMSGGPPPGHMGHGPPQHRGMGGQDQMGGPMGGGPMGHPCSMPHGGPMGHGGHMGQGMPMGQGPMMVQGGPMGQGVPMGPGGPMKGGPDQMCPNPGGMSVPPNGMNGMPSGMGMGGNQGWSGPAKSLPIQSGKIYPHDQSLVHNPQNPNAPPIYPCGVCHKEVHDNDQAIPCESGCHFFFHRVCTGLSDAAYHLLMREIYAEWVCDACLGNRSVPLVKYKP